VNFLPGWITGREGRDMRAYKRRQPRSGACGDSR
jgi:hypothetical protein